MIENVDLEKYLHELLDVDRVNDYCPNGLQIEGRKEIQKIVFGVTACVTLIERAIEQNADALLVHHGFFWKSEPAVIKSFKHRRISLLIKNDINLYAYHLPLDIHSLYGNNIQLSHLLKLKPIAQFGPQNLVLLTEPIMVNQSILDFIATIESALGRQCLFFGDTTRSLKKIAICTGGAQSFFEEAVRAGVDVFITGEVSEAQFHLAQESGVVFISAGHHATERYGVASLSEHLQTKFGLDCQYIDVLNPV